ncbi:AraC family transcriptional regulator [Ornithinimicrobium sp. F0845]|uniref:helix-turn-helix domain-containing protein n=1 Tax=Ornithinimicrobium sp. F0845 TaxID=2926412 RepID=UPI001FF62D44|nr:AraC family transcriptional regulator [Ornithinimicrobium sp. F0845]MCK0111564.1 AraC family transcriptional regulator [Ornithinimicrobium sp. F0845]
MSAAHPIDRARLTERADAAPPVHRYGPPAELREVVRHYWVPVWDLGAGITRTEQVLQYPTCLIVVSGTYARFYGVARGLSTVELAESGWAVGVMLQPGAGQAVAGQAVSHLVDTYADLGEFPRLAALVPRVREVMAPDPSDTEAHVAAIRQVETRLVRSVGAEGLRLNAVVEAVESDPDLLTVGHLAQRVGLGDRALQRLTVGLLGLTPKWLIQRRRLHDAADQLKHGQVSLADLASDLGYTDQAHFTRDFRAVTGYTPGEFARVLGRDARR